MGKRCPKSLELRIEALELKIAELEADQTPPQTLTLNGNSLEISDGNSVDLTQFLDNKDEQVLSANLNGTDLVLEISNGNTVTVPLASLDTDLDEQTLTLNGNSLEISNGNSVDLTPYLDNSDEQILSGSLNGTTLEIQISNGNTIQIPLASLDTDDQTLSLINDTLAISEGNSVDLTPYVNTDNQTLALNGSILSISGGNSVNIPLGTAAAIYQATGRAYLYSNSWRGLNETYGYDYYQWSQTKGAGANPAYSVQEEQGFLVVGPGVITKLRWVIERNSTAIYDAWMDVAVIRNGTIIPVGRVTSTDNSTDNRFYSLDVNTPVQENDIITWAFRKSAGALTYGYSIVSIEVS